MQGLSKEMANVAKSVRIFANTWPAKEGAEVLGIDEETFVEMAEGQSFDEKFYGGLAKRLGGKMKSTAEANLAITGRVIRKVLQDNGLDTESARAQLQLRTPNDPGKIPSREDIEEALAEIFPESARGERAHQTALL